VYTLKFRPSSHSDDLSELENYQALTISVTLPMKASKKSFLLLLSPEEGEVVKELFRICGKPDVKRGDNEQWWFFTYSGNEIYFPATNFHSKATIYLKNRHYPLSKIFSVTITKES
jgi:hypothetical protein